MKTNEGMIIKEPYGFIYITTNMINSKRYLGQKLFDKNNKWKTYLGSGKAFKNAVKKYGKENFSRNIVCFCYSKEELNQAEYDLSVFLNVVESDDWYNVVYGGGSVSGYHHTEETKRHLSNILSGENSPHYGKCLPKEQRDKIREKAKLRTGEKNPFYGKHHTEETKEKLRNISYGQNMSEETRTKISNALKGRPSPNKGKPSPNKGKKLSDEKKKQLSILCLERGNNSGKNNPRSIPIVQLSSDGEFIAEWEYTKQAAIALGVDNSSLSKAVKNHSLFKGYWWIKLEEYSNIDINSLNKK